MVQRRLAHIRDRELQTRLLEEGLLTQQQIQAVLLKQYQQYQQSQEELRGLLFQVSLRQRSLQIKQSIELTLVNTIELSHQAAGDLDWPYWGRQLVLLDSENPRVLDNMSWLPGDAMGLTLSPRGSYLYTPDLGGQPLLPQTRQLLNPHQPGPESENGPYDLFVDAQQKLFCVLDRQPGDLWLVDTGSYEVKDIFTLRQHPGSKALLLEPDPERQRVLFVDQERPALLVLEYGEGLLEEYRLNDQVPVQLALHEQRLYLLLKEPEPAILCLDALRLSELFKIPLPGPLYSEAADLPANPFALSPDGRWLCTLTGSPQNLELHWLNTQTLELQAPQPLASRLQPAQLVFASPNPLQRHRRRLAQLLIDEQLLSEDSLLQLFPDPHAEPEEPSELEIIGPAPVSPISLAEDPPAPESEAALLFLSPIERLTSLPEAHKAENLPLPESAADDVLQILSGSFFQHTGVDLEQHPQALEKLAQAAQDYRLKLQDYDVVPVIIPDVLEGMPLKTILLRESIVALMELRHMPGQSPYDTPPSHCPDCRSPLLGHWDCDTCGMELLNPERALKRQTASVLPHTWLPAGYFAITDVQSGRLLLVNTHRYNYVTWQIDFRYLPGAKQPWDMLWLKGLNILLTDRAAHRVLLCNHAGRILWELNTKDYPELGLDKPVKATTRGHGLQTRYLIVDQGQHRVLEVDRQQRISWHYGHRGVAGESPQFLNNPNDIQYTHEDTYLVTDTGNHRVLEIQNDRVIKVFGAEHKLKNPVFAERLFNGHTLIVDAGHSRLLEIDENGRLKREVVYFREGMDERFNMAWPLKMVRRENQNVVLIDANRVMEIDPLSKQIVWFSFLHELKLEIELPTRLRQSEIRMPTADSYSNFRVESPDPEHMPTLRRTLEKVELFESESPFFFEALEEKLHYRRYSEGEVILRKGQIGHSFFILQSGQVAELAGSNDEPTLLLEPGDSFGFMGIIYREARKTSIQAHSDCGVYVLEKRDFDTLLENHPELARKVQKLASERLVLARLKQTPKSDQAASRLKNLIAAHKERAHERLSKLSAPPSLPAHHEQLQYSEIEKHVISAAQSEGLGCLELQITLRRSTRMKAARVALIASMLDRVGTIIRTEPAAEQIMDDKIDQQVTLTLLTNTSAQQLSEDMRAVADVEQVDILKVEL